MKTCGQVYLMWSYPLNNLTMIIERKFHRDYQSSYEIEKYLIENGKEMPIKSKGEFITLMKSYSNYQIQLKLQAQTSIF